MTFVWRHPSYYAELRKKSMIEKETVYLTEPWTGICDNEEHPMFTVSVTEEQPTSVCYYCSKTWKLKKDV